MANDDDVLKKLIAGGLIGAGLGAWLSKDKEDGAFIGAILGAAFAATLEANEKAKKSNLPVLVAENGKLYEMMPNGNKKFIKDLPQASQVWEEQFKLKTWRQKE
jgi:hypothetical protein